MENRKLLLVCGIIVLIVLVLSVGVYSIVSSNANNKTVSNNITSVNNTTSNMTNVNNTTQAIKDTNNGESSSSHHSVDSQSSSNSQDSNVETSEDDNYKYYWNDVSDPNGQPHEGYGPSDNPNIIRWRIDPNNGWDDYYTMD